jgi:PAS domain S-box-containing protein
MVSTSSADVLRRLAALHDHLPAGVVVYDKDGQIIFANRLAQELLGQGEAEMLGIPPTERGLVVLREDRSIRPREESQRTSSCARAVS